MENGIYIGLSKQVVLRNSMDTIANNIANMNTTGYRAQNMLFEEYIDKERKDFDPMSFVYDRGQYSSTESGSISVTGNQLDIALAGPGFIGVQGGAAGQLYTRAGNFQINADGVLMTANGDHVASSGGGDITIPQGSTEVKIAEDGTVSNEDGALGQIMISEFADPRSMKPTGNNLYSATQAPQEAANTRVKQGAVEGSNVQPIIEMTRMIDTLRDFQSLQNIMQTENDRLRGMIDKLTQQA